MPFGRGFGFRGWSPGWPYVGLGRGGLPRCWGYGPYSGFWDAPYHYPYGFDAYSYGPSFSGWGDPYGPPMTAQAEVEWLKDQAESIKQEMDRIKARISELEKE